MKTKETSEAMSSVQRFLRPSQKPERIDTDTSKKFFLACQDVQWNRETGRE